MKIDLKINNIVTFGVILAALMIECIYIKHFRLTISKSLLLSPGWGDYHFSRIWHVQ